MTDNMMNDKDIDVTAQAADQAADLAADLTSDQAADQNPEPGQVSQADADAAAEAEPEVIESMDDYLDEIEQSLKRLREGDTVTGTVSGVYEDHITLDLPYFAPGIIYVEELSFDPEFSIMDDVHNGDTITAMVIDANDGSGNVVLSRLEAAENSAWDELKKAYEDQSIHTVKVAEAVKSGVTAYLCGIRGFIPASKLDLAYVEEADLASYVGKNIQVQVITADEDDKRLVLSAKEVLKKRAAEIRAEQISRIAVGSVLEGTVQTLKPYGAFIGFKDGTSGLLHISQITDKRISHPKVVLKEGQKVKVQVINIKDGKLSLSMKALNDAPAQEPAVDIPEYSENTSMTSSFADLLKGIKL